MGIESYKASASLNTSLGSISVAEGMQRAEVSDSLRQMMADIAGGVAPVIVPKKFGAVGDGTTNDTTAITSFDAASGTKYVPDGTYLTTLASSALNGPFRGTGQIKDTGGKRAPFFSAVKSPPATLGTHNSAETAFNGDLSKSIFQVEHRITGNALSQPTTGYVYTPEAYPFYGVLYNSSGWNQGTADDTGRTAAAFFRVNLQQYGLGDCVAFNAAAFVTGARAGATSYLANPAASFINGDMTAGSDGIYFNPLEFYLKDAGHDVTGIGAVINLERTNAVGALGCWWGAFRAQSKGSSPVNNVLSAVGKFNAGIDFTMPALDLGANKTAISLKADQRISFNNFSSNDNYTTSFQNYYLTYDSATSSIQFVVGGSIMQVSSGKVAFIQPPQLPTIVAASLPTAAAGNKGMEYYVSDLNSTTRGAAAAGGGANFGKVYSTGSAWLIA